MSTYRLKKGRFEDNFLVFERDGDQYIREWTSLTGMRVKTDPAFAVTMAYANVQTLASKTSSWVYAQVEGKRHVYSLFVLLKKIAYQLFKQGYTIETVYSWLREAVSERGFWWEEWAEGKQAKAVVMEIVRKMCESRQGGTGSGFEGIEGELPAAVLKIEQGAEEEQGREKLKEIATKTQRLEDGREIATKIQRSKALKEHITKAQRRKECLRLARERPVWFADHSFERKLRTRLRIKYNSLPLRGVLPVKTRAYDIGLY